MRIRLFFINIKNLTNLLNSSVFSHFCSSPDPKLTLYDPLLLTGGFEKAKQKLLQLLKVKLHSIHLIFIVRAGCNLNFPAEKKQNKTIDTIIKFVMVLLVIMGLVLVLMETVMDPVGLYW